MSNSAATAALQQQDLEYRRRMESHLARRYRSEKIFRTLGLASIVFGLLWVGFLFADIAGRGLGAFVAWELRLEVRYDGEAMEIYDPDDHEELALADYRQPLRGGLRALFPDVSTRAERSDLYRLLGNGAELALQQRLLANPELLGQSETLWLPASRRIGRIFSGDLDGDPFKEQKQSWVSQLEQDGRLRRRFNRVFFVAADSRDAETAGIRGALQGSLLAMLICFLLAFPIGIAAAVYLERFAPRGKLLEFIEININNLAAVPSIIFGLLGLAIFLNWFGLPRSAPLVGGMVLALMTLPTIIISSRAALRAVPPSVTEAALAMGASELQTLRSFVLPLAMPGMMTGTIIGMARALGETAPLLMIGMVAFISESSFDFTSPATALPVQIYLWVDNPEQAFTELTSAAILVLLIFLALMNTTAAVLRQRSEKKI